MHRQWVPCDCNFSYNFDLGCIDSGYLVIATSHIILTGVFETLHVFSGVCSSACGLGMIFKFIMVTISTLTLSFSYLRVYASVQTVGTF